MPETPLISVIMPVYNVEKYLPACLNSLLAQTFSDFELICVNDGSTDSSAQILADFAAKDKRIKIINQENKGLSAARNTGFAHAQADWIYFIDSDDAAHPQLLEIAYAAAQKYQADMVCFGYQRHNGETPEIQHYHPENIAGEVITDPLHRLLKKKKFRLHFNVWSKLYKRDLIKDIAFVEGMNFEDYPFTYRLAAQYPKTVLLREKLYFYTYNPQSISRKPYTVKNIRDYQAGINDIYADYMRHNRTSELKYLKKTLIPRLLKNQYKQCLKATGADRDALLSAFTDELVDSKQKGLLSLAGHNWWRYWQYRKLLKKQATALKVVKLMGGLGNQMFQYAFGQALQNANPKDKVLYDVEWFKKAHKGKVAARELGLSLFGINPPQATPKQAKIFAGKNKIYNLFCPKIPRIIDAGWGKFRPEILHQSGNIYYNGYFQNEEYFANIDAQIRRDFAYPPLEKDDSFNQEWLKKIQAAENPICIHLRRGDYLNLAGWVLPLSYYQNAVAYIKAHVKNPTFFVFGSECDDYIQNEFDIGAPFELVGEENARNHADWKDMMLMSACKHAVIANSTFSWWAAWLGENKTDSGIIVAPSPFVENDEIIPTRWIKIER